MVVTRPEEPDGPLVTLLRRRGARVLHWPVVRIDPPEDPRPLEAALERLDEYDWIVFSSARAVSAVAGRATPSQDGPRVAAVGSATAGALTAAGWRVDLTAHPARGAALVQALAEAGCAGARVLFPASAIARPTIPDGLRARGARVEEVTAYRTRPCPLDRDRCLAELRRGAIAAITFASPSAVDGLQRALGTEGFDLLLAAAPSVAIGPTTAEALDRAGHPAARVAEPSTIEGLVRAVEQTTSRRKHQHGFSNPSPEASAPQRELAADGSRNPALGGYPRLPPVRGSGHRDPQSGRQHARRFSAFRRRARRRSRRRSPTRDPGGHPLRHTGAQGRGRQRGLRSRGDRAAGHSRDQV
ncbi:MAG: uroporphyrinogen-III synthase [bacterium]|nr:uroporphyrinogen-III synthase [bacterium]